MENKDSFKNDFNIFKDNFNKWSEENPDISQAVKDKLLNKSRLTEEELSRSETEGGYGGGIIKIPFEKISDFEIKGVSEKKLFSEEALGFLKNKGVEFIIILGKSGKFEVSAVILPVDKKDGDELENIFTKTGSPLRWDYFNAKGWSLFVC